MARLLERQVGQFVAAHRARGIDNAAVLLADHRTGAVAALVGSANYGSDRIAGAVDGTRARRSPGSTLKPFIYVLALDQRLIHAGTLLRDAPTRFADYAPENFDGGFAGPLSATQALVKSRNVPAVALAAKLSGPSLHGFLRQAGVGELQDETHYGLGIALGGAELSLRELVSLYTMLPQQGRMTSLRLVQEAGRRAPGAALLSPEAAFVVLQRLAETPRPDALDSVGAARPAAAIPWKTGTSWGFRDAWSVGVVGPFVLGVWVGDFASRSNPAFVGRTAAAPLFFAIADALAAERVSLASSGPIPRGVKRVPVCALSGALPGPDCPHVHQAWFLPGRSPIDRCGVHRRLVIDDRTGLRVCQNNGAPTHAEVFEVWPSDLASLFAAAGLARRALPPSGPGCRACRARLHA